MSYLLGSDIGTGSVKAVAMDLSGKIIDRAQQDYPLQEPQPGYSEQSPEVLLAAWIATVRTIAVRQGVPLAVSLSSAMHGLMAVDEQGAHVSPFITWSDLRAADIAERLRSSPAGASLYLHTGTPVHAMSPLCKIIWMREQQPALFQQAHRFISIKEYIWFRLFGRYEVDQSIASATGLFDIMQKQWHAPALELAGIGPERLSAPVPTHHTRQGCAERLAQQLQLTASTVFCIGASDGCLASLGTQALQPGTAAITIGTSGAVRIARPAPLQDLSTLPFSYVLDEQTFICGGAVNNGGNIVQWLLQKFCGQQEIGEQSYASLFHAVGRIPAGAEGLVFLPYLHGERSPVWDERSCGVFFGIRPRHGHDHFLRAALEGICFGLQQILLSLEDAATPVRQIRISGGFAHERYWPQLLADITGKQIWADPAADASCTGAIYLAARALGYDLAGSGQEQRGGYAIEPQTGSTQAYEKNIQIFRELYHALQRVMHHGS